MAETTLLKNSAIISSAAVGAAPPHGMVKTGALPLVKVKSGPGGPQVQAQQMRAVEILPPRNEHAAVQTGGLPMVSVKMTSQGPQLDDGQHKSVVILPPKDQRRTYHAGALPVVDMKMTSQGPQINNLPTVQAAPPQIQNAAPAVSQPRVPRAAVPTGHQVRGVVRIAAPQALPPMPELSVDQLMLGRHLFDKYAADLRATAPAEGASVDEASTHANNLKIAEGAIETFDRMLVAIAIHTEAAEKAAAAAAAAPPRATVAVYAHTNAGAHASRQVTAGQLTQPQRQSYNMANRNASMAPRRVMRGGSGLPPVIVTMTSGKPTVQNQAEVQAARAARLAPQEEVVEVVAPGAAPADVAAFAPSPAPTVAPTSDQPQQG